MPKRLYRSRKDSVISGVCGGLGEHFDVDPVVFRLVMVLLVLVKGVGILAYIIAWIVIPQRPLEAVSATEEGEAVKASESSESSAPRNNEWKHYLPGIILVAIGLYFLVDHYWWWMDFDEWILPAILLAVGVFMIIRGTNRKERDKALQGGAHDSSQV